MLMESSILARLDADLISAPDRDTIANVYDEIKHDFKVKTIFRTMTEARISVLSDVHHPTPHAKYWQSVREQQVHFDELVWLSFNFRTLKVELKKLDKKLLEEKDELERELLEIEIEKKHFEIIQAEKVASERVREIQQWSILKAELVEGGGVDTENVDTDGIGQLKSHAQRFIKEMFNSGNNLPPADAQNILGKAITAVRRCKEVGLWVEVREELGLNAMQLKAIGE